MKGRVTNNKEVGIKKTNKKKKKKKGNKKLAERQEVYLMKTRDRWINDGRKD